MTRCERGKDPIKGRMNLFFCSHIHHRFDSIKYDVKKIEEVVYDISLRGLQKDDEDNEQSKKKAKLSHNE